MISRLLCSQVVVSVRSYLLKATASTPCEALSTYRLNLTETADADSYQPDATAKKLTNCIVPRSNDILKYRLKNNNHDSSQISPDFKFINLCISLRARFKVLRSQSA